MDQGIIIRGVGGQYTVAGDDGQAYICYARGIFRQKGLTPTVGDRVAIEQDCIVEILPRRNILMRPAVANIDYLLICMSASDPKPDLLLIDQLLVQGFRAEVAPILCINKSDLLSADSIAHQYRFLDVFILSAKTREGLDGLLAKLAGKITCAAGQSGVGKSSIISCLTDRPLQTGEISKRLSRGKHTTRHAELIPMRHGGWIVDTPGFSLVEQPPIEPEEFSQFYPDFEPFTPQCRFHRCLHDQEPDCAVRDAAQRDEISIDRWQRYQQILHQKQNQWRRRYD